MHIMCGGICQKWLRQGKREKWWEKESGEGELWVKPEMVMGFLIKINYLTNLKTLVTPLYTSLFPTVTC